MSSSAAFLSLSFSLIFAFHSSMVLNSPNRALRVELRSAEPLVMLGVIPDTSSTSPPWAYSFFANRCRFRASLLSFRLASSFATPYLQDCFHLEGLYPSEHHRVICLTKKVKVIGCKYCKSIKVDIFNSTMPFQKSAPLIH